MVIKLSSIEDMIKGLFLNRVYRNNVVLFTVSKRGDFDVVYLEFEAYWNTPVYLGMFQGVWSVPDYKFVFNEVEGGKYIKITTRYKDNFSDSFLIPNTYFDRFKSSERQRMRKLFKQEIEKNYFNRETPYSRKLFKDEYNMKLRKVKGSGLDKSDVYVLYKKDLILQTT
jgi:hypothetical protein